MGQGQDTSAGARTTSAGTAQQTEDLEQLRADALRYRFIRAQMQAGAVTTQLPLRRSLFWVGTHVDCSDVRSADEAIDAAIAGGEAQ